jgi:hypothetical protein
MPFHHADALRHRILLKRAKLLVISTHLGGLRRRLSERNVRFGLWVPIGLLIASAMTAVAWGGERSSPTANGLFVRRFSVSNK